MKTKLFIVLFATVLGAVITGCNHQSEENNPGAAMTNSAAALANTNSASPVNVPAITATNGAPMTTNTP